MRAVFHLLRQFTLVLNYECAKQHRLSGTNRLRFTLHGDQRMNKTSIKHLLLSELNKYKTRLSDEPSLYINNTIYNKLKVVNINNFKKYYPKLTRVEITNLLYLIINHNFIHLKQDDKQGYNIIKIYEVSGINVQVGRKIFTSKLFTELLKLLLDNEIIIKVKNYQSKSHSNQYKLNDNIISKMTTCQGKIIKLSPFVLKYKIKFCTLKIVKTVKDDIYPYKYLLLSTLKTLNTVQFPTIEEVEKRLDEAVKNGESNKGKIYKNYNDYRNLVDKSKYTNIQNIKKVFLYLTTGLIFSRSEEFGRIYTSFNMIPTITRNMCKLNNNELVGLDFNALHLNIAQSLAVKHYDHDIKDYNEITHDNIASYMKISRQEVKIDNLSLLNRNLEDGYDYNNKRWEKGLIGTPTVNYFLECIPVLYNYIVQKGDKGITKFLFNIETKLMDKIAMKLLYSGINFMYIFDEIMVESKYKINVRKLMLMEAKRMWILAGVG